MVEEFGYRIQFFNGGYAKGWVLAESIKRAACAIREVHEGFSCFGVWREDIPSHLFTHSNEYILARVIGWEKHGKERKRKSTIVRTVG